MKTKIVHDTRSTIWDNVSYMVVNTVSNQLLDPFHNQVRNRADDQLEEEFSNEN